MTTRIVKLLTKLRDKDRRVILQVVSQLLQGEAEGLDVKKLIGTEHVFRVRKGNFRIVFQKQKNKILIIAIERRSESTYQ